LGELLITFSIKNLLSVFNDKEHLHTSLNGEEMPKFLIVDDSNMLRNMMKYALNGKGYSNITEAEDGVDALKKANSTVFDVIITDINMPNMGGFDLIEALRKLPTYAKTPILALTTENKDDIKAKGKSVGATGWIVKPFVPEQLLKAVTIVLSR
jgi:two-component system chemotaxis response regulator CheY